jgi:hypothetical protein
MIQPGTTGAKKGEKTGEAGGREWEHMGRRHLAGKVT